MAKTMYNYFLYITLIKLETDFGKAFKPPCEITPQISINLGEYTGDFMQAHLPEDERESNTEIYTKAVRQILENLHSVYNTPMGWLITNEKYEPIPFKNEGDLMQRSQHSYAPMYGQMDIDLEYVYKYAVARFQSGDRGMRDAEFNNYPYDDAGGVEFLERAMAAVGLPVIIIDENTNIEDTLREPFRRLIGERDEIDNIPFTDISHEEFFADDEPVDEERAPETLDVYETPESIEDRTE